MSQSKTKISFVSSIILVVASTIGAGIFFKNEELAKMSQGSLLLVILSWIIGGLSIVCLSLSLSKIASKTRCNRGLLGWANIFLPRILYKAIAIYKKVFYLPIIIFTLSIYASLILFEGLGVNVNQWSLLLTSFAIFIWFMITNLISLKFSEMSQWVMTFFQLLPLIIFPLLGFINFGNVGDGNTIWQKNITPIDGVVGLSPYITIILGLPSVLFSFVGFQVIAAQRDDLAKPEKLGQTMFYGVLCVTLIYLLIVISFNVGSTDGTHNGIATPWIWLKNGLKVLIAVGIMGVINGILLGSLTQWKNMMLSGESQDLSFIHQLIWKEHYAKSIIQRHKFTVWLYFLSLISSFFVVFGLIGIFGTDSIKSLADYVGNYVSLMIIIFLTSCVLGALLNKQYRHLFIQDWTFKFTSIMSSVLIFSSLLGILVVSFVDLSGINNAHWVDNLINLMILFSTIFVSLGCSWYQIYQEKKHHNKQDVIPPH